MLKSNKIGEVIKLINLLIIAKEKSYKIFYSDYEIVKA